MTSVYLEKNDLDTKCNNPVITSFITVLTNGHDTFGYCYLPKKIQPKRIQIAESITLSIWGVDWREYITKVPTTLQDSFFLHSSNVILVSLSQPPLNY